MTVPDLGAVTIANFRSIRGTAAIPMDAPVVLLHGTNGAGKSTVMSALELALTGTVSIVEDGEEKHLVHRGADEAQVELTSAAEPVRYTIDSDGIHGKPLLAPDDGRFFRERCYLQQRTLGRLLELYEKSPKDGEAPLTEFVKDLLGIDELDAVMEGLHPVGDKRRIKRLIPTYGDLEKEIERQEQRVQVLDGRLQAKRQEAADKHAQLGELLDTLHVPRELVEDLDGIKPWLDKEASSEGQTLVGLVGSRRELEALARRATSLVKESSESEIAPLEQKAAKARAEAAKWHESTGAALEDILNELRKVLPGTPAFARTADPMIIHTAAAEEVGDELDRLTKMLAADEQGRKEAEDLEEGVAAASQRLVSIDEQLASSSTPSAAEELARALAALIPHVHTEDCPVCGRDYSEISSEPLAAGLATRISDLSAQAERLQDLSAARLEALSEQQSLEGQIVTARRKAMGSEAKVEALRTIKILEKARKRLSELEGDVSEGAALIRKQTETERDLAMAREKDQAAVDLRSAIEESAALLNQPAPAFAAPLSEALQTLVDHVAGRIASLEKRAGDRVTAHEALALAAKAVAEQRDCEAELTRRQSEIKRARIAKAELERRREVIQKLCRKVEKEQRLIVRRVFTETLNRTWRDLFVRLAPEEPFVPAFRIPETNRQVTATLETVHRDGEPGGSPASMLSAGNLNTAALTLFLALNLSVTKRLPWLLLDDPVQSMDEVHVAQFAALLRTLTREQGRRVVLAVHERALFDYLALELSPAAGPNEGLVTVELARGPDGSTSVDTKFHTYEEDRAFAPVDDPAPSV
jgi:DNA repair protein SbcC/Rad50